MLKIVILQYFILVSLATRNLGILPPSLFALDIGDGAGLQIFRKMSENCLYYTSVSKNPSRLLSFKSGEWLIRENAQTAVTKHHCAASGGKARRCITERASKSAIG